MKKIISMIATAALCAALILSLCAGVYADTYYCVNCHTSISSRWVCTPFQHFATCACGAVIEGYSIHTADSPMRACPICYPNGAPVQVTKENPEIINAGKDLTLTVPGKIYSDQIHLYSAKDKGNHVYEYNKYIKLSNDDVFVGEGTVTLKASILDTLESGCYALTVVTSAGSQFFVMKK